MCALVLTRIGRWGFAHEKRGSNGGVNNNRIFFQADDKLIAAMRGFKTALPEWDQSSDLGGVHAPFDATSETLSGQPRGQSQFWSDDTKSKPLTGRTGVEDVNDPHVVEIDLDYNFFHDSNPEASYFPNGTGREYCEKVWSPKGTGGGPEYDYVPTTYP